MAQDFGLMVFAEPCNPAATDRIIFAQTLREPRPISRANRDQIAALKRAFDFSDTDC
jgi:hypothetical protein